MISLSAADFTGPCALSLGFLFGGFNTVLGTAFCPFTGWVMVNISLGIHNHRLTVCRQSWGYQNKTINKESSFFTVALNQLVLTSILIPYKYIIPAYLFKFQRVFDDLA